MLISASGLKDHQINKILKKFLPKLTLEQCLNLMRLEQGDSLVIDNILCIRLNKPCWEETKIYLNSEKERYELQSVFVTALNKYFSVCIRRYIDTGRYELHYGDSGKRRTIHKQGLENMYKGLRY